MQEQPETATKPKPGLPFSNSAQGIALIYFILSACWILLSDAFFLRFATTPHELTLIQTVKGWFFVTVTAVLVYFLVRSSLKRARESERQLTHQRSEVDLIIRNLPGMLYRAKASDKYPIEYASNGAERLTGRPLNQFEGKGVSLLDLVEEEDRDDLLRKLERAGEYGTTFHAIHRIKRPNGGIRHVLHDGRFKKGEAGAEAWLEGLLTDMTAEIESLQSLRDSEERLRAIIERSSDGIYIFQGDQFVLANPRFLEMYGYTADEIYSPGFNFLQMVAPEDQELVQRLLGEFLTTESVPSLITVSCLRKDGTRIQVEGSVSVVDWDGKPAILAILRDVTQTRKMEKLMSESQRLESVGRLAGGVAHDFNNLLTSVTGNAELAEYKAENGQDVREELREIRKIVGIASSLTRRLLTFSRQQPTEAKQVSLNELMADIVILVRRLIGPNIRLEMDLAENIGNVMADGAEMEQVLINLAVNARDAMAQKGGTLTIRTREVTLTEETTILSTIKLKPGLYVLLQVEDTGEGMTTAVRERIFEPFFTTKDQDDGTGFGLATVYGIVSQAGGGIHVESIVNEGSTFTIYLPSLEPEAVAEGVPEEESGRMDQNVSVLLVDDDETVRKMLVKSMSAYGIHTESAPDGETAISTLEKRESPVDLVITDVMMPGIDGMELSRHLLDAYPKMKIILMSGYTSDVADEVLLADPRVTFLGKPVGPKRLTQQIREIFPS